ncbi:BCCT family transporter [Gottfriedia acidiceleris]|uniref:BCCT family transporter n=1 Tax=Gottfriedia acidiceleris TaxID=371036 RepID=UPI001F2FF530|nr:BCCT family transporter [Gottfriedia acidiceleris]
MNNGGLDSLQSAAILAAFPFAFIVILILISLFKELQKENIHHQSINKAASPFKKLKDMY